MLLSNCTLVCSQSSMELASVSLYRPYLVNAPLVLDTAKSNSDIVKKNLEWCFKLLDTCNDLFPEMYREEHSIEYYKSGVYRKIAYP